MVSNARSQLDFNVGSILHETVMIQVGTKWGVVGSIPARGRKVRKEPTPRIEPTPKMTIHIYTQQIICCALVLYTNYQLHKL